MPDDPISPPATPPGAEPPPPAATTPSSRRPLLWVALGAAALGVAGGGAAAVALSDDPAPARVAVTAAADDETTPVAEGAEAEGDAADGECVAPGEHRRPGAHGTVTGVDGATVTIEDDEGTATTVTTDDETTVLDVAEGDAADVAEGDTVVVMGETGDDEGVTARHVTDLGTLDPEALHLGGPGGPGGRGGPGMGREDGAEAAPDEAPDDEATPPEGERPERLHMRATTGTVASVDGDTFTVTTDDGDVVVTTTDETAVTVVTEIAVSDLAEGDTVAARGETDDEGTVAADVVIRGELEAGRPGFGPGLGGPGGHGRWSDDGERPDGPPEDEGTTTTTEA